MKPQKNIPLLIILLLFTQFLVTAQDKSAAKFGKIIPADFDLSKNTFDSSASAVVIADIGSSEFEQNTRTFSLVYKRFVRLKIINKTGFAAATVEVPLDVNGNNAERIENLKAVTYNLENGKITEQRLDDKSIFIDKFNRNFVLEKFTLPGVKEGSLIEYTYTVRSDFFLSLRPWAFQGNYPCLWSEYKATIPTILFYVIMAQGYQPFFINSKDLIDFQFTFKDQNGRDLATSTNVSANEYRWVMKDVPPLKEEDYTTTLENHYAKLEFQLSQIRFPNGYSQDFMQNWNKLSDEMMKNDHFGADLNSGNGWLDDDMRNIVKNASGKLEKARRIYQFIQSGFACTNYSSLESAEVLKTVFKNKSGNEASINLLLTAMLTHAGIEAEPVILSTREHGYPHEIYPLLSRFNYVICAAMIDGQAYYLDASQPLLGFGRLTSDCYNGCARVINKENSRAVYFIPDSVVEKKQVSVFISNDEKNPKDISGNIQVQYGENESFQLRKRLAKTDQSDYFKEIRSKFTDDIDLQNEGIDSVKQPDEPLNVHFDFAYKNATNADVIYFSPVMTPLFKENPLKSMDRTYPVEMPYTRDEVYILNMDIPAGYVVDEMPKSERIVLNENDGFFEYMIDKDDNSIQLRSRIKLNKATFNPEDYSSLRNFFAYVVKKQSDQIVFKKKR